MSEDNEEENSEQSIKVRVSQDATPQEKEEALKDALYIEMKKQFAKRLEKHGLNSDVENMTVEEMNRLTEMLNKLDQQRNPLREGSEFNNVYSVEQQTGKTVRIADSEGYDSIEDMIRDVRQKTRSANPAEKAEAEAVLDLLWKKYGETLKANIEDPSKKTLPLASYEDKDPKKAKKIKQIQQGDI